MRYSKITAAHWKYLSKLANKMCRKMQSFKCQKVAQLSVNYFRKAKLLKTFLRLTLGFKSVSMVSWCADSWHR